jgi:hypothetical protein
MISVIQAVEIGCDEAQILLVAHRLGFETRRKRKGDIARSSRGLARNEHFANVDPKERDTLTAPLPRARLAVGETDDRRSRRLCL